MASRISRRPSTPWGSSSLPPAVLVTASVPPAQCPSVNMSGKGEIPSGGGSRARGRQAASADGAATGHPSPARRRVARRTGRGGSRRGTGVR